MNKIINKIESNISKFKKIVSESNGTGDICSKYNFCNNGKSRNLIKRYIKQYQINTSHFGSLKTNKKYDTIEKECPICKKMFKTLKNHLREKTTCSHSCSNTFFAKKRNKPENYKNYRTICFSNHIKECVICKENKIVTVHHMDNNHNNNDPKNLVPLCPTHHQYWHSKYRNLIREKVESYVNNFKIVYNNKMRE